MWEPLASLVCLSTTLIPRTADCQSRVFQGTQCKSDRHSNTASITFAGQSSSVIGCRRNGLVLETPLQRAARRLRPRYASVTVSGMQWFGSEGAPTRPCPSTSRKTCACTAHRGVTGESDRSDRHARHSELSHAQRIELSHAQRIGVPHAQRTGIALDSAREACAAAVEQRSGASSLCVSRPQRWHCETQE